jgi:hypothetical protein
MHGIPAKSLSQDPLELCCALCTQSPVLMTPLVVLCDSSLSLQASDFTLLIRFLKGADMPVSSPRDATRNRNQFPLAAQLLSTPALTTARSAAPPQAVQPECGRRRFRLKGRVSGPEFNKVLERHCAFVCARTRRRCISRQPPHSSCHYSTARPPARPPWPSLAPVRPPLGALRRRARRFFRRALDGRH